MCARNVAYKVFLRWRCLQSLCVFSRELLDSAHPWLHFQGPEATAVTLQLARPRAERDSTQDLTDRKPEPKPIFGEMADMD